MFEVSIRISSFSKFALLKLRAAKLLDGLEGTPSGYTISYQTEAEFNAACKVLINGGFEFTTNMDSNPS